EGRFLPQGNEASVTKSAACAAGETTMAQFTKYPGSAGTWSAEQNTLMITLGEMAQILLVGGGPPGQEKLNVGFAGAATLKMVQEFPWDVPNQRVFCITPERTGEIILVARLPNNGPRYAEDVHIVVLPRKPSSVGPENVILFSQSLADDEKEGELGGVERKAVQNFPESGTVVVVQSYAEFVTFLTTYRDTGRRIASFEVFSHGCPGAFWIVNEPFDTARVRALRGKGFH